MQYNTNTAISVSVLTNRIRSVLESDFLNLNIEGEISNFKHHSSGHKYFTLKDDKAQIKCVMWRGRGLSFQPRDGMKVIANGNLTVYPPQGNYQLDCLTMRPMGEGDLYMAFEALKAKLSSEGYFDSSRKKLLPKLPFTIGISTSATGAALQDMISTLRRRLPYTKILFRPTLVQGEGSAEDIVKAINELSATKCEVIIIGRGGGSIEDLWSYNTEMVANAIYDCKKPIVSAIGHETDFTIADFVSDSRAPTPTAAAELCSPITIDDLDGFLYDSSLRLFRNINSKISQFRASVIDRYPRHSSRRIKETINQYSQQIDSSEIILLSRMKSDTEIRSKALLRLEAHLKSVHPLSPFEKGFAALKSNGKFVGKNESIKNFENIEIVRKIETITIKIIKDN
jgi:exodeoxyribonuclease VII large subunit